MIVSQNNILIDNQSRNKVLWVHESIFEEGIVNTVETEPAFRGEMANHHEHNLSRVFLRACQKGDLKTLEKVKERWRIEDWTIHRHDSSGDTGLHVAAREGHLKVVKWLCENWEQPSYRADVTNRDMKRPLHEAAQFSRIDVLQYLIQQGVLIDSLKRADWTPLMLACTKSGANAQRCIQTLLSAGADPCVRNRDGWNSLFIACRTGDIEAVKALLLKSPKCIDARSNNGKSALHVAAFHGAVEIVDHLIALSPDILHARDTSGSTALHESAKNGILRVTERLIELGADVGVIDNVGQNFLHVAATCHNVETMEYILKNNFIDATTKTHFGVTPLRGTFR